MKTKNIISTLFCIYISYFSFSQIISHSQWLVRETQVISSTKKTYDIEIADGRNDNINRIYVTTKGDNNTATGGVYECTYSNGSWSSTSVKPGLKGLVTIAIGDGRDDGVNRLYFVEYYTGGKVYEATYTGSNWNVVQLFSNMQSLCVFVGEGRNDGISRVYVGGAFGLAECSWNSGTNTFDKVIIDTEEVEGVGLVGDTRNDGQNRVCSNGKSANEFTWNGSSYIKNAATNQNDYPDACWIATGRNDQTNRVYSNTNSGRMEFTNNNGTWTGVVVDNLARRGDFYPADVKNDNKQRIYTTLSDYYLHPTSGPMLEYSWNGSSYSRDTVLDAVSGATAMVTAGKGRNDDTIRLYAPNYVAGTIYEITNIFPKVVGIPKNPTTDNDFSFTTYPNPGSDKTTIDIQNKNRLELQLEVMDLEGKLLYNKSLGGNITAEIIDLSEHSKGVYFIKLSNNKGNQVRKMVVE